jgi:DNA-binding GntR family transcriptional regulator
MPPDTMPADSMPLAGLATLLGQQPNRPRTATEFVEAALRLAILGGHIAPGTPLRQEDLAALFGVSRMPVREALRQLEAQALVDFEPHKGAVVTEISAEDAADNYAIRRALEPAALALSIPNLTGDDFERAEELLSDLDGEEDQARLGDLNRRFHLCLYGAAGRPKLLALVNAQLATADRYLRFHLAAKGRDHLAQAEHRALLAACRARDAAAAQAVLLQHLDTAAETIARFFAERG